MKSTTSEEYANSNVEKAFDPRPPRLRSPWLVAGLTMATLGIYLIIWVGITWSEIKREVRDPGMNPLFHSLAMVVPVYSFFRFHANFRMINELLEKANVTTRVVPMAAIAALIGSAVLLTIPVDDIALTVVNPLAAAMLQGWAVFHGQSGLNAYWENRPGRAEVRRASILERLIVGFGIGIWLSLILASWTSLG